MVVGGSCYPASAAFLTDRPNAAFDEFKMGAIGQTAIYCEEPDGSARVYLNNLKEFTGGGILTAAHKFGRNARFPNFGALFIGANPTSLPHFDPTEEGISERMVAFPCLAKFCANPTPGTNERAVNPRFKNLFLNPGSEEARAMITATHCILVEHMRSSFKPEILDVGLGSLPLGPIVTRKTNDVLAQGNTVLAFLMDENCPFELAADDSAMAPFEFFEEDWLNGDWARHYSFPRTSKDFKKLIEQIDRGDGIKVKYHEGRVRSPLWANAQKRPYVGVRRKNQPSAVAPAEAGP